MEIPLAVAFESLEAFLLEVGKAYRAYPLVEDHQGLHWVGKAGKAYRGRRKEL